MDEVNPADNTNNKKPLISFWANADWLNPKSIITRIIPVRLIKNIV